MFERRIQMGEGECLTLLEMASNVALGIWDEAEVLVRLRDGQEQDLTVETTETGPAVSARVGCEVRVPASLPVKVREVRGNMSVTGLSTLDAEQVRGNLKLSHVKESSIAEVYGNLRADGLSALAVVGTVFGDAGLKAVDTVDLQNVRGNLLAKGIDHLRASRIGGNLQAKEIGGALDADRVGGNALLKGIAGAVTLDQVAGNLTARNLTAGAKAPKIGGNLVLNGEIGTGCTYHFHARGNATLRLPEGTGAHVNLSAGGKILSSAALADERRDGNTLSGTMGDGGAEIAVEARGNIMLGGGEPQVGAELGEEISRQIEESLSAIDLEAIGRQVSEEMEAAMSRLQVKLESVDWDRIGVQTQRAVERAMEQMRRNVDRMAETASRHQERLERKMEAEKRRLEKRERRHQRAEERRKRVEVDVKDWAASGAPQAEDAEDAYRPVESEPDLDDERLSILRMVEQGQITPEEAEMLLDALQE